MNKNSLIGIILIMAVLIGWSVWMTPSKEELARQKFIQDSIYFAEKQRAVEDSIRFAIAEKAALEKQMSVNDDEDTKMKQLRDTFGVFASAATGEDRLYVIKNKLLEMTLSTKGAYVKNVLLTEYVTWDSLPLVAFDEKTAEFNIAFFAVNRGINTYDLYFEPYLNNQPYNGEPLLTVNDAPVTLSFRAYADNYLGDKSQESYIEFAYTMKPDEYMVDFDINMVGMKDIIPSNTNFLTLDWNVDLLQQEKAVDRYNGSTVYYKYLNDDVESLSETSTEDEEEEIRSNLKWISFKQRFFSNTLVAKDYFDNAVVGMKTLKNSDNPRYLKSMYVDVNLPYNGLDSDNKIQMSFYFGPNSLKIMEKYDIDLEKQIPLGGKLVSWINRYIVVNVFNWLGNYGWNYGIVILVLTVIIKICLMPFAFKSYMSSAKMRVLKPEIDEISAKYPKQEDAMKKQQAIMDLYKKAGASPMSGCLPMLLQLPILWAIFRFFPSSIELRQQPFLWADDLSTYDSVLDLPFNIPFYGDHVSLFTLLMTIATLLYTYLNNKMIMSAQGSQSMPGMKLMMYLMPIVFLGVFNSYSAGLSYYYLLVNLFTFLQMYLFRLFVNEDKLRRKIEEAKKKPVKKSRFQKRLEEMQRQQQQMQKNRK